MSVKMAEKMAEAIRRANAETVGLTFTELSEAMALAALKAMREPTFSMVAAPQEMLTKAEADYAWCVMIDAAIAEAEQ